MSIHAHGKREHGTLRYCRKKRRRGNIAFKPVRACPHRLDWREPMPQIISAGIACVVLGLAGWNWYFMGTGDTSPAGHEFGTGVEWLTVLLYIAGFAVWIIGLPALLRDPRRHRITLQLASAIIYFWPVGALVVRELNDRYLGMHVRAEYTVEWKCPAAWQDAKFRCEVDAPGGLNSCQVRRNGVAGDVLQMSGGPIFVQSERQIIRLHQTGNRGEEYLFCVDLYQMKNSGDVSDWIIARSSKLPAPNAWADAQKRFFCYGDPSRFSPIQNPDIRMRFKIVTIDRQRGR
jgi:hypothetical protein